MAQLQGFPACCGAQILTGLYADTEDTNFMYRASAIPKEDQFHYFTVAITNPTQHNDKGVVKALRDRGFEPIVAFTGNGGDRLHLWARGREWKPIAGAKGNMKQQEPGCTCTHGVDAVESLCAFCKAVKKAAKVLAAHRIPRQPAGRGTRGKMK